MENIASVAISHQELNLINQYIYETFPGIFKLTINDRSVNIEIDITEPGVISSNGVRLAYNMAEGTTQIQESIIVAPSRPNRPLSSSDSALLNLTLPKTNIALKMGNTTTGEVSGALNYVLKVYPALSEGNYKLKFALTEMSFNGTGNEALKVIIKNFWLPAFANMIKPAFNNLTFDLPTYGKLDINTAAIVASETGIVVNYGNNGSAPGVFNAEVNEEYTINRINWAAFKQMLNSTIKRNFYGKYPSKTHEGDNVTMEYWMDFSNEPILDKNAEALSLTFNSTFKVQGTVHTPRPLPDIDFNTEITTQIKLFFLVDNRNYTLRYFCNNIEMDPQFEWHVSGWQSLTLNKEGIKKEILDQAVPNIISQFTGENSITMINLPRTEFTIDNKPFVVGSGIRNVIHGTEECVVESSLFWYTP